MNLQSALEGSLFRGRNVFVVSFDSPLADIPTEIEPHFDGDQPFLTWSTTTQLRETPPYWKFNCVLLPTPETENSGELTLEVWPEGMRVYLSEDVTVERAELFFDTFEEHITPLSEPDDPDF